MKLTRAKIPMCPECGAVCRWDDVDGRYYDCTACNRRLIKHHQLNWGYYPDEGEAQAEQTAGTYIVKLDTVRRIMREVSREMRTRARWDARNGMSGMLVGWADRLDGGEEAARQIEHDPVREKIGELERLRYLLTHLDSLPALCPSCVEAGHDAPKAPWDGDILRCPQCGAHAMEVQ